MNWEKLLSTDLLGRIQDTLLAFGLNLLTAALIFIFGRIAAKLLTGFVRRMMERGSFDAILVKFIQNVLYVALMAMVVVAAISALGVQTASVIAVIGAAGLAIGLALQGSLSNFAAGVLIVLFRPYRIKDYVEAGGVSGTVQEVEILTTVMITPDNRKVIVPNSQIMGGTITNFTAKDSRRIDLVVGVSYTDDLDLARSTLLEAIGEDPRLLAEPAPLVEVFELGDSSVNFVVRPWVSTTDYWPARFALMQRIKKKLDAAGLSIPFPQRDVHIYQHDGATEKSQVSAR